METIHILFTDENNIPSEGEEFAELSSSTTNIMNAPQQTSEAYHVYALIPVESGLPVELPTQPATHPSWPSTFPPACIPTASSLQLIQKGK